MRAPFFLSAVGILSMAACTLAVEARAQAHAPGHVHVAHGRMGPEVQLPTVGAYVEHMGVLFPAQLGTQWSLLPAESEAISTAPRMPFVGVDAFGAEHHEAGHHALVHNDALAYLAHFAHLAALAHFADGSERRKALLTHLAVQETAESDKAPAPTTDPAAGQSSAHPPGAAGPGRPVSGRHGPGLQGPGRPTGLRR
jgi:hypothetical protein